MELCPKLSTRFETTPSSGQPSQLKERRHPTRKDLDAVSTELPVYIIHQSGHLGAGNSKALEVGGIDENTKEMPGGVIRRAADGKPDGVFEETPHFVVMTKLLGDVDAKGGCDHFQGRPGVTRELWLHDRAGGSNDAWRA